MIPNHAVVKTRILRKQSTVGVLDAAKAVASEVEDLVKFMERTSYQVSRCNLGARAQLKLTKALWAVQEVKESVGYSSAATYGVGKDPAADGARAAQCDVQEDR